MILQRYLESGGHGGVNNPIRDGMVATIGGVECDLTNEAECLAAGWELLQRYDGNFEADGRVLGTGEMLWMCRAKTEAWPAIAERFITELETLLEGGTCNGCNSPNNATE